MTTGQFLSTCCANPEGTGCCTGVCDVSSFGGVCAIIAVFFYLVVVVGIPLAVAFFLTFLLSACTSYDSVD